MLMIQRAGQLDFGSLQTYSMGGNYTTTKQSVKLTDGSFSNSFVQAPQLLLLECLEREQAKIAFQNPTAQSGFGTAAANSVAPGVQWPLMTFLLSLLHSNLLMTYYHGTLGTKKLSYLTHQTTKTIGLAGIKSP